ncbi:hypothetical protein [Vitiosangium sp. GDMCC 1.1324]|uniref:hypothetical protein n=1 Tax=Vitiosangium sp. (strain GDMCC 1.1324) TaxID=2138576 RepID=UPI000D3CF1EE|nr:hypothetical protein [Vitiosangium sp. GDMCC 1.1324]PTL81762.1 hypothetical protein DAT35_22750 [Vitiosangium sp. GDMCC 1.1324]
MMNRVFGSIAVMGVLALGAGCGGTELEEAQSPDMEAVTQAATEEPRKLDDLIGALDRDQGVLHVRDDSQDVVLRELQAQRVDETTYLTKDALTGEATKFVLQAYPLVKWLSLFKLCPNGQYVFSWLQCPTLIVNDPLTRVWMNSTCNWKIQSAGLSSCVNTSSGASYRFQYLEAWKCGVGTGFCVERRGATAVRYDYALASCDPSIITNVQSTNYNFLCKK